jgi:hypothetical protein
LIKDALERKRIPGWPPVEFGSCGSVASFWLFFLDVLVSILQPSSNLVTLVFGARIIVKL